MKKSLLFIGLIAFAMLLLTNSYSNAQTQCTCTKQNQDYTLVQLYLGDKTSAPLPSDYECLEGPTKVYIWAIFGGNATRYSLFVHYEMFLDNVLSKDFNECFFRNQAIPTGNPVVIDSVQWVCGAEVRLDHYVMTWQANQGDTDCGCTNYHGCYGSPVPIVVKAPLVARMTSNAVCTSGSVAQNVTYTDNSTGGNYYTVGEPYAYLWNFGPTADYTLISGSLSTSPVVVKYLSSGSKTAVLTVTDSTLVSRTVTETVTVTPCLHIVTAAQPATFECSNTTGITAWLDGHGGATVAGNTGTVTWTWSPNPYVLAGGCAPYTGTVNITFTATDALLNPTTTSATLTIADTAGPLITKTASNLTVECDGSGNTAEYSAWLTSHAGATASDVCDSAPVWSYREGSWETLCGLSKQITVAFWATDDCGNKSSETSATFKIQDTTPPSITQQAAGSTVECDGAGNSSALTGWLNNHGGATASENCGTVSWSNDFTALSDGCGATGSATVTFWATDACGNKSSGTSAVFTIADTTPPSFSCPQNINSPADQGETFATVTIGVPTVSDGCGTTVLVNSKTGTSNASGTYPLGPTTVTYTATDACNNVSTCTFTVTVLDQEAPALNCPANITNVGCLDDLPAAYADYDAFVLAGGSAVDNQGINTGSFRLVSEVSSQTTCPEIITRVYEIQDNSGTAASCTQTIRVDDETAPVFTVIPANMTAECGLNPDALSIWLASARATDNCSTVTPTHNFGEGPGMVSFSDGCGNTGSATITWTAVDDCGNTSTVSAVFTIVDTTPPDFTPPAPVTVNADVNCEYDASPEITGWPTALSDNCSTVTDLTVVYQDTFVKGVNPGESILTRSWKITDPCGNSSTKTQVILVIGAKAPPTLVLTEICVYLTEYGKWTLNEAEIKTIVAGSYANCGSEDDLTFTFSDRNFDCLDAEATKKLITVTATDSSGSTISGTVWISVADTLSPIAVCKDATVYLNAFGNAFLSKEMVNKGYNGTPPEWAVFFNKGIDGSYDNCGIEDVILSRQLFTCADLASPKEVIMTAVDPSGNTSTCKSMITVLDTLKPVITPVANVTVTVPPGVCATKITYPAIQVTDNCGVILERLTGLGPDGMFPLGTTTTETWKATNVGGTSSQISFTVTVNTYNGAPVMNPVADVVLLEDALEYQVLLSGIGYGPDCVSQQILSLDIASSNTGLLKVEKVYVNGSATGTIKITPLKDKNGEAIITLTLKDNGGTANGGVDTMVKTFKVTVTPVNDPPTVTPIPDQMVTLPNTLSVNVKGAFSDVDAGDTFTVTVTLDNGSPLPAWMSYDPVTGLLTGSPTLSNLGVVNVKATATDLAGASVSDVFRVIVLETNASILVVNVVKGTAPVTSGINVVLFVKDGTMFNPVVNTPVAEGGTFTFYNVAKATYLAKAIVTDPVANPGLLNTYHTSAVSLTTATQVAITAAGTKTIQISMVSGTLAAGTYKIMGKVVRRTGTPNPNVPPAGLGTPAPGIDLVLKLGGNIVANTVTGVDGTYAFDKLPAGEFEVSVEVAGYTQDAVRKVTLSATEPLKDKIDFTIWTSDNTHVITRINDLANVFDMKIYPNPTTGRVNIDITWNNIREADVTVFTLQGAQVFQKKFFKGETIEFNLSENATGVYMVQVNAGSRVGIEKLIIDRR